jgi:16S rRNA (guanine527-N7)-methyltransferase
MAAEDSEGLLRKGLEALGLTPSDEQVAAFMAHLALLQKWNRVHNLTALAKDRDIIVKHFLDSCLYLPHVPPEARSLADVGSGAGFPGIPVKLFRPELAVWLIEPSSKRAAFLRQAVRTLGLRGVQVLQGRLEDVSPLGVDVAVTRALMEVAVFVRKASRIVRAGGTIVMSKGPRVKEEAAGLALPHEVVPAVLPFSGATRFMVVVHKTA